MQNSKSDADKPIFVIFYGLLDFLTPLFGFYSASTSALYFFFTLLRPQNRSTLLSLKKNILVIIDKNFSIAKIWEKEWTKPVRKNNNRIVQKTKWESS